MIRVLLHVMNGLLLLALVGCFAGTLAGLIVFVPFVGGAWALNLMALLAYENGQEPRPARRVTPARAASAPTDAPGSEQTDIPPVLEPS